MARHGIPSHLFPTIKQDGTQRTKN